MIDFIDGQIVDITQDIQENTYLIIQSAGLGYRLLITHKTAMFSQTQHNQTIRVYTTLIVREDAMTLVGFIDKNERQCFELLMSASGVGAKSALAILNSLSVTEITLAIVGGEHKILTAAKGVGPKLAEKMTIELRDKMKRLQTHVLQSGLSPFSKSQTNQPEQTAATLSVQPIKAGKTSTEHLQNWAEAQMVLYSLGYEIVEVQQAISSLQLDSQLESADPSLILERALKYLSGKPVA